MATVSELAIGSNVYVTWRRGVTPGTSFSSCVHYPRARLDG